MIPVSTLYGEYIDRPKLTEQKNAFEYIVPPPSRGSEQKNRSPILLCILVRNMNKNIGLKKKHNRLNVGRIALERLVAALINCSLLQSGGGA